MDDFLSCAYDVTVVAILLALAIVGLAQHLGGADEDKNHVWSYDQADQCWYSAAENGDRVREACPMKGTVTE